MGHDDKDSKASRGPAFCVRRAAALMRSLSVRPQASGCPHPNQSLRLASTALGCETPKPKNTRTSQWVDQEAAAKALSGQDPHVHLPGQPGTTSAAGWADSGASSLRASCERIPAPSKHHGTTQVGARTASDLLSESRNNEARTAARLMTKAAFSKVVLLARLEQQQQQYQVEGHQHISLLGAQLKLAQEETAAVASRAVVASAISKACAEADVVAAYLSGLHLQGRLAASKAGHVGFRSRGSSSGGDVEVVLSLSGPKRLSTQEEAMQARLAVHGISLFPPVSRHAAAGEKALGVGLMDMVSGLAEAIQEGEVREGALASQLLAQLAMVKAVAAEAVEGLAAAQVQALIAGEKAAASLLQAAVRERHLEAELAAARGQASASHSHVLVLLEEQVRQAEAALGAGRALGADVLDLSADLDMAASLQDEISASSEGVLRAEVSALSVQLQASLAAVEQHQSESLALLQQLETVSAAVEHQRSGSVAQLEHQQSEAAALQQQHHAESLVVQQQLHAVLADAEEKRAELQQQLHAASNAIEEQRAECSTLQQQLHVVLTDADEQRAQCSTLQQQLHAASTVVDEQRAEFLTLQQKLHAASNYAEEQGAQCLTLQQQLHAASTAVEEQRAECSTLQQQLHAASNATEEQRAECSTLQQQLHAASNYAEEQGAQCLTLQQQLHAASNCTEEQQAQCLTLQQQLERSDHTNDDLTTALMELRQHVSDIAAERAASDRLAMLEQEAALAERAAFEQLAAQEQETVASVQRAASDRMVLEKHEAASVQLRNTTLLLEAALGQLEASEQSWAAPGAAALDLSRDLCLAVTRMQAEAAARGSKVEAFARAQGQLAASMELLQVQHEAAAGSMAGVGACQLAIAQSASDRLDAVHRELAALQAQHARAQDQQVELRGRNEELAVEKTQLGLEKEHLGLEKQQLCASLQRSEASGEDACAEQATLRSFVISMRLDLGRLASKQKQLQLDNEGERARVASTEGAYVRLIVEGALAKAALNAQLDELRDHLTQLTTGFETYVLGSLRVSSAEEPTASADPNSSPHSSLEWQTQGPRTRPEEVFSSPELQMRGAPSNINDKQMLIADLISQMNSMQAQVSALQHNMTTNQEAQAAGPTPMEMAELVALSGGRLAAWGSKKLAAQPGTVGSPKASRLALSSKDATPGRPGGGNAFHPHDSSPGGAWPADMPYLFSLADTALVTAMAEGAHRAVHAGSPARSPFECAAPFDSPVKTPVKAALSTPPSADGLPSRSPLRDAMCCSSPRAPQLAPTAGSGPTVGTSPMKAHVDQLQTHLDSMVASLTRACDQLDEAQPGEPLLSLLAENLHDCMDDSESRLQIIRRSSVVNPLYIPCDLDSADPALVPHLSFVVEALPQPLRPNNKGTLHSCDEDASMPSVQKQTEERASTSDVAADAPSPGSAKFQRNQSFPVGSSRSIDRSPFASATKRVVSSPAPKASSAYGPLSGRRSGVYDARSTKLVSSSLKGALQSADDVSMQPLHKLVGSFLKSPAKTLLPATVAGSRYVPRQPAAPARSKEPPTLVSGVKGAVVGGRWGIVVVQKPATHALTASGPLVTRAIASLTASVSASASRGISRGGSSDVGGVEAIATLAAPGVLEPAGGTDDGAHLAASAVVEAAATNTALEVPIKSFDSGQTPGRQLPQVSEEPMPLQTIPLPAPGLAAFAPAPATSLEIAVGLVDTEVEAAEAVPPLLSGLDLTSHVSGSLHLIPEYGHGATAFRASMPPPPRWEARHDPAEEEEGGYRVGSSSFGCGMIPRFGRKPPRIARASEDGSLAESEASHASMQPHHLHGVPQDHERASGAWGGSLASGLSVDLSGVSAMTCPPEGMAAMGKMKRSFSERIKRKISKMLGGGSVDASNGSEAKP